MTKEQGIAFDPGFGPYILAFQGPVEYMYTDINRFKNLSQKKVKFMQYYKKILDIFYNNIGFYTGCLMWASYITKQKEQPILGNHCLGKNFDETEDQHEVAYLLQFVELFPKDMKYFLGKDFKFENNIVKLLNTYKEFSLLNEGFTNTKTNSEIKLPKNLKASDVDKFNEEINKAINKKDLSLLADKISLIIE